MSNQPLPSIDVVAFGVGLETGEFVGITPFPDKVVLETMPPLVPGLTESEQLALPTSQQELSYEEYEALRAKDPRYPAIEDPLKSAQVQLNNYPQPGALTNTCGVIIPCPKPLPDSGNTEPPVTAENAQEKSFLGQLKGDIQQSIDDWVEAGGDSKLRMGAGALGTAINEVFTPEELWELIPVGKLFKIADKGIDAIKLRRARSNSGGRVDGRNKGKADDACPAC